MSANVTRTPYKIIIEDDCWHRRTLVTIEPRTISYPTQSFRDTGDALTYAGELSRLEGWPVIDRRGSGPEAA